jgi:hypothetical protein
MCPSCKQDAPIVYRGAAAHCAACGAPRIPFSTSSVTLAGKPAKAAGTVARIVGWLTLVLGGLLGFSMIWIGQLLWPAGFLGWAIGVPILVFALVAGLFALFGGKRLRASGETSERAAQFASIRAMILARGGAVTAIDVARTLGTSAEQADALLTEMTKLVEQGLEVEVDDDGNLFYRLAEAKRPGAFGTKYRVQADGRVRIEAPPADAEAIYGEAGAEAARRHRS